MISERKGKKRREIVLSSTKLIIISDSIDDYQYKKYHTMLCASIYEIWTENCFSAANFGIRSVSKWKLQPTRLRDSKAHMLPTLTRQGFRSKTHGSTWHRINTMLHSSSVWPIWEAYHFGEIKLTFTGSLDRDLFTYRALSPYATSCGTPDLRNKRSSYPYLPFRVTI